MGIILREPDREDEAELVALHIRCWEQTYAHLLPEGFFDNAHREQRTGQWQRLLAEQNPAHRLAVAEADGRLRGFALAAPPVDGARAADLPELQLYNLYVLASDHGTGIGQGLLDRVLQADPAFLWVEQSNARAVAFYRRNGFGFDGLTRIDPLAPEITDALMVRR